MNMLGGATNAVLFLVTVVLSILNFVSLKKESPFRSSALWLQILPLPVTIGVYWGMFRQAPSSPLYLYLMVAGLLLGLLMGALTRVYRKGTALWCRRSKLYLLLWLLFVVLTQATVKTVGTAAAGIGTALMFFSLGMVVSQQLVVSAKAGAVGRRPIAAVGALLLLLALLAPLAVHAAPAPDPFKASRDGAHAYFVLAKDAFAKKDMAAAMHYARLVVESTTSPGTKAKGYMVMWLATRDSSYQGLAHTNILDSGQMKDIGGNREGAALLIGLGIIEDIEGWKYQGYAIAPNTNVITIDGVYAVANSQLPGLWKELKAKLGVAGIPALAGVIRVLDGLVAELAESQPVSAAAAGAAGAAASGILLVSSLLNLFATAAAKVAAPQAATGVAGAVTAAPTDAVAAPAAGTAAGPRTVRSAFSRAALTGVSPRSGTTPLRANGYIPSAAP